MAIRAITANVARIEREPNVVPASIAIPRDLTARVPSWSGSATQVQGNDLTDHTGSDCALTGRRLYRAQRRRQLATTGIFAYMGRP